MKKWNKTENPAPYTLVLILLHDMRVSADMKVPGEYGNLVWKNWDDRSVIGWKPLKI